MRDGDAASAMQLVNDGLGLAPNHAGFKKVKARLLMAAGDVAEAADLLVRRAPTVSDDIEYHEILATRSLARDYEGARLSYSSWSSKIVRKGIGGTASRHHLTIWAIGQWRRRPIIGPSSRRPQPELRRRSQERLAQLNQ